MITLFDRFHHVEECDDGNLVNGDGCSAACVIEPGWQCEIGFPDTCTPIKGFAATAANAVPREGLLSIVPIQGGGVIGSGRISTFGWASFISASELPGSATQLPAIFRHGPAHPNDAVETDAGANPISAAGDAFVCPCAGVSDNGGVLPGLVVSTAGVVQEPAGVYPRDGADCSWIFPYSQYQKASPLP